MLHRINITRPRQAARGLSDTPIVAALLAGLACLAQPAQVVAQTARQPDTNPPAQQRQREPNAEDVTRAWFTVREWLDAFSLPDPDTIEAKHTIQHASGVCIIVRRNGRVLGIGSDLTGDELMLRRAAGRAFGEVHGNEIVRALQPSVRKHLGTKLTLELEVAGPMRPLLGRTFRDVSQRLRPGLDGVAMRRKGRTAARFPAQMLATNTARTIVDGQAALPGLAVELDMPVRALSELRSQHNVSVYRFETIHLAQRTPDATPFATFRGDTVVAETAIDEQTIRVFADGLVSHLMDHQWPGKEPHGLLGNYDPIADDHQPLIAPPMDQALAVLALARYASFPDPSLEHAEQARTLANRLFDELATVTDGERDPLADPATCAAVVCAMHEPGIEINSPQTEAFARRARDVVVASLANDPQQNPPFRPPDRKPAGHDNAQQDEGDPATHNENQTATKDHQHPPIDAHGQALLAWATVRLAVHDGLDVARARSAVEAVLERTEPAQAVVTLPWLGWAAMELAETTGEPIVAANRFGELLRVLDAARLDRDAAPDLGGGLALTRRGRDHALADSQTARPAAFVASAVRYADLVPVEQQLAALGRHLRTVRFLVQLQVGDDDTWRYPRSGASAAGGLCNAQWDATQPVPAQALGLLTAIETLESLVDANKIR